MVVSGLVIVLLVFFGLQLRRAGRRADGSIALAAAAWVLFALAAATAATVLWFFLQR